MAAVEPSKAQPPDPSGTPTPRRPGLANVFWGAGIRYQKLTSDQRRSISRFFAISTVFVAVAVGVVVAILNGVVAGTVWAAGTLVLMGLLTRSALSDYE